MTNYICKNCGIPFYRAKHGDREHKFCSRSCALLPTIRETTFEEQCLAIDMLEELESNYLEVVLIPAKEKKHTTHYLRAVQYANADWYRAFCEKYVSNRKGSKLRTRIKRKDTINALNHIIEGYSRNTYTERLLEFMANQMGLKNDPTKATGLLLNKENEDGEELGWQTTRRNESCSGNYQRV